MRIIVAGRDRDTNVVRLGEIIWTGTGLVCKVEPGKNTQERRENIRWVHQCRSELDLTSYETVYKSMERLQWRYSGARLWVRFEPDYGRS